MTVMCVTFIDQYVSCKAPSKEDGKLKDLVTPPYKSTNIPHIAGETKHVVLISLSLPVQKPSLQKMILKRGDNRTKNVSVLRKGTKV